MTVMSILARKGHDVLTIEPTAALSAATKLLAERRIGALVVTGADHRIVGNAPEVDLVVDVDLVALQQPQAAPTFPCIDKLHGFSPRPLTRK